jgi:capsular polysaccharide biosynthesis protein
LLFLVRRNQFKRLLLSIDEICDVAERAGFQLIAPEEYSIVDQVRLFGTARAVAGPAGAAFTNTLFCRDSTRVVPFMKEESSYPTYTDLAIALDLSLRYVLGRTDEYYIAHGDNLIAAPYRVDGGVVARQLAWAAE